MKEYHSNLSKWFRSYIEFLTHDIRDEDLWTRHEYSNSPGWNIMHLIAEGELALKKINPGYSFRVSDHEEFCFGSDGNAVSELSKSDMLNLFKQVYDELDDTVIQKLDVLYNSPNSDELLKDLLRTELDFCLHILTTHIAMHCNALTRWRQLQGMQI